MASSSIGNQRKQPSPSLQRRAFRARWLGRIGEWRACLHVYALGWRILAVRWRRKRLEVDIIAKDGNTLVICEVKTRSPLSHAIVPGADAVDAKKKRHLKCAAKAFQHRFSIPLRRLGIKKQRFDIVEIIATPQNFGTIRHLVGSEEKLTP